ncbi:hypothetical protein niasHT_019876 [Heterodera trifolii]|uniref:F-box domain-containing protein n=1 Tax=Heterodera trifolii TaxID=157864 RepID=A0ABD2KZ76_9BILA
MVPKCLPLELLFEIVPFIPAEKAVPNALSSCRLLHKLLLPRVIKWKEIMSDNINFQNEIREELKKINQRITVQNQRISAIEGNCGKINQRISVLEGNCGKAGETTDKAPNAQKERGNGHKAVIGDYNENNGTIEVPLDGYNVGKAIAERILNTEKGTVLLHGMREPISLAKAVEIGFFDNLSLTVADPNTLKVLFLDEALRLQVLDSNGRMQHRHQLLTLHQANRRRLVCLEKSKPTSDKKIIKLEPGSPKTSIQPDKTSNSTSSTSNIYPKSDKPSDSTSDSSIQPDKTSMAVIGDYNENNDTIEVPLHGYNIGKMIVEGILDAESGTVVVDGMHEPISLAKAVEIGFFDNLSLTVADPNTMELLFLDEALRRKVLDSNGRLQHRQLKLSKAIEQNLVLLVKSKPTSHKKSIKLESGSPKTSIQPDKTSTEPDKMPSTSITSMQPDKTSMAVIGDYNENNGTIKVPYHGYHIGQAINERILDAESGTVVLHGMHEPISLAKAVEIGVFDNLSLSVADPNTMKMLFLDEALGRKVLDSNGRLQHRQLKLSEAKQQGFVHIGRRRATRDCRKKTLKLEPRSPQTSIQLDKTSNSISNKSTEPDKTSSISNYPKSDKPSNSTSDSSIQPDKTSNSTSSTSNIYPKSDKPSDSTSDSSIQPDKTSMDFWNFTSMVTLINEAIRMNSSMERGDLLEMLCMYGPTTCENALDTPDQLEAFVAEHCPSVRIESVGKGNGAKKFFHWNSADDQTCWVGQNGERECNQWKIR